MTSSDPSAFLRRTLILDAAVSGTTGIALWLGASILEPWLALPASLLRPAGLMLLPFAALLVIIAARAILPRPAVVAVIVANGLWVAASVALLLTGQVRPTMVGVAFVVVQAVAVLGFAELQWVGLRRATAMPATMS